MRIQRGDIVFVELEPIKGKEQGGIRPCLIIQNDISNNYSPVTIIAPITSKLYTKHYPTNVFLDKTESHLDKDSTILLNQIRAIDKIRILKKVSSLPTHLMKKVDIALRISLELD